MSPREIETALKLSGNGYEIIMAQLQKIEDLAWKGIYPDIVSGSKDLNSYYRFQDIISEAKNFRQILHENFIIELKPANPKGNNAA